VLLATDGRTDFSKGAVAAAAALAPSGPIAVVTIAKVYGSAYGMPNPGLLPTKQEMAERLGWVAAAVKALEKRGAVADGQVASTRKPVRQLSRIALARGVRFVVIDETTATGWRRRIEGDVGADLARKLRRHGVEVRVVPATR
jgi:hypothetical protein